MFVLLCVFYLLHIYFEIQIWELLKCDSPVIRKVYMESIQRMLTPSLKFEVWISDFRIPTKAPRLACLLVYFSLVFVCSASPPLHTYMCERQTSPQEQDHVPLDTRPAWTHNNLPAHQWGLQVPVTCLLLLFVAPPPRQWAGLSCITYYDSSAVRSLFFFAKLTPNMTTVDDKRWQLTAVCRISAIQAVVPQHVSAWTTGTTTTPATGTTTNLIWIGELMHWFL